MTNPHVETCESTPFGALSREEKLALFTAWIDGAEIEYLSDGKWSSTCGFSPCWSLSLAYRIKPAPLPDPEEVRALVLAVQKSRQWVEANTAQVRDISKQAAEPGESMLREIDAALAPFKAVK